MIKLCATGNDFLLIDLMKNPDQLPLPSQKDIAALCHRNDGFGADGFIILKPNPQFAFEWDFYNSDGSQAEMCGNAARAVAQYFAHTQGQTQFEFKTLIGAIKAHVENPERFKGQVSVTLPLWKDLKTHNSPYQFMFINTGVPHAVIETEEISDLESLKLKALKIKALPEFLEKGVNVTFRTPLLKSHRIQVVTFERGVENFTLSCGTGAIAAAVSAAAGATDFQMEVRVPGGELSVKADKLRVTLTGEGRIIGTCLSGVIL